MSASSAEPQQRDGRASNGVQGVHAARPELHVDSQLASQAVAAALPFTEVLGAIAVCKRFQMLSRHKPTRSRKICQGGQRKAAPMMSASSGYCDEMPRLRFDRKNCSFGISKQRARRSDAFPAP